MAKENNSAGSTQLQPMIFKFGVDELPQIKTDQEIQYDLELQRQASLPVVPYAETPEIGISRETFTEDDLSTGISYENPGVTLPSEMEAIMVEPTAEEEPKNLWTATKGLMEDALDAVKFYNDKYNEKIIQEQINEGQQLTDFQKEFMEKQKFNSVPGRAEDIQAATQMILQNKLNNNSINFLSGSERDNIFKKAVDAIIDIPVQIDRPDISAVPTVKTFASDITKTLSDIDKEYEKKFKEFNDSDEYKKLYETGNIAELTKFTINTHQEYLQKIEAARYNKLVNAGLAVSLDNIKDEKLKKLFASEEFLNSDVKDKGRQLVLHHLENGGKQEDLPKIIEQYRPVISRPSVGEVLMRKELNSKVAEAEEQLSEVKQKINARSLTDAYSNENLKDINKAKNLTTVIEMAKASLKNDYEKTEQESNTKEFVNAVKKKFTDFNAYEASRYLMGVSEITDIKSISATNKAFDKRASGVPLSKDEQLMLDVFELQNSVKATSGNTEWYDVVSEHVPTMARMMQSFSVGSKLVPSIKLPFMEKLTPKLATSITEAALTVGARTATADAPVVVAGTMERLRPKNQILFTSEGQEEVIKIQEQEAVSYAEAGLKSYLNAYIERSSEGLGEVIQPYVTKTIMPYLLGKTSKISSKAASLIDNAIGDHKALRELMSNANSKFALSIALADDVITAGTNKLGGKLAVNAALEKTRRHLSSLGVQSIPVEIAEEWVANRLQPIVEGQSDNAFLNSEGFTNTLYEEAKVTAMTMLPFNSLAVAGTLGNQYYKFNNIKDSMNFDAMYEYIKQLPILSSDELSNVQERFVNSVSRKSKTMFNSLIAARQKFDGLKQDGSVHEGTTFEQYVDDVNTQSKKANDIILRLRNDNSIDAQSISSEISSIADNDIRQQVSDVFDMWSDFKSNNKQGSFREYYSKEINKASEIQNSLLGYLTEDKMISFKNVQNFLDNTVDNSIKKKVQILFEAAKEKHEQSGYSILSPKVKISTRNSWDIPVPQSDKVLRINKKTDGTFTFNRVDFDSEAEMLDAIDTYMMTEKDTNNLRNLFYALRNSDLSEQSKKDVSKEAALRAFGIMNESFEFLSENNFQDLINLINDHERLVELTDMDRFDNVKRTTRLVSSLIEKAYKRNKSVENVGKLKNFIVSLYQFDSVDKGELNRLVKRMKPTRFEAEDFTEEGNEATPATTVTPEQKLKLMIEKATFKPSQKYTELVSKKENIKRLEAKLRSLVKDGKIQSNYTSLIRSIVRQIPEYFLNFEDVVFTSKTTVSYYDQQNKTIYISLATPSGAAKVKNDIVVRDFAEELIHSVEHEIAIMLGGKQMGNLSLKQLTDKINEVVPGGLSESIVSLVSVFNNLTSDYDLYRKISLTSKDKRTSDDNKIMSEVTKLFNQVKRHYKFEDSKVIQFTDDYFVNISEQTIAENYKRINYFLNKGYDIDQSIYYAMDYSEFFARVLADYFIDKSLYNDTQKTFIETVKDYILKNAIAPIYNRLANFKGFQLSVEEYGLQDIEKVERMFEQLNEINLKEELEKKQFDFIIDEKGNVSLKAKITTEEVKRLSLRRRTYNELDEANKQKVDKLADTFIEGSLMYGKHAKRFLQTVLARLPIEFFDPSYIAIYRDTPKRERDKQAMFVSQTGSVILYTSVDGVEMDYHKAITTYLHEIAHGIVYGISKVKSYLLSTNDASMIGYTSNTEVEKKFMDSVLSGTLPVQYNTANIRYLSVKNKVRYSLKEKGLSNKEVKRTLDNIDAAAYVYYLYGVSSRADAFSLVADKLSSENIKEITDIQSALDVFKNSINLIKDKSIVANEHINFISEDLLSSDKPAYQYFKQFLFNIKNNVEVPEQFKNELDNMFLNDNKALILDATVNNKDMIELAMFGMFSDAVSFVKDKFEHYKPEQILSSKNELDISFYNEMVKIFKNEKYKLPFHINDEVSTPEEFVAYNLDFLKFMDSSMNYSQLYYAQDIEETIVELMARVAVSDYLTEEIPGYKFNKNNLSMAMFDKTKADKILKDIREKINQIQFTDLEEEILSYQTLLARRKLTDKRIDDFMSGSIFEQYENLKPYAKMLDAANISSKETWDFFESYFGEVKRYKEKTFEDYVFTDYETVRDNSHNSLFLKSDRGNLYFAFNDLLKEFYPSEDINEEVKRKFNNIYIDSTRDLNDHVMDILASQDISDSIKGAILFDIINNIEGRKKHLNAVINETETYRQDKVASREILGDNISKIATVLGKDVNIVSMMNMTPRTMTIGKNTPIRTVQRFSRRRSQYTIDADAFYKLISENKESLNVSPDNVVALLKQLDSIKDQFPSNYEASNAAQRLVKTWKELWLKDNLLSKNILDKAEVNKLTKTPVRRKVDEYIKDIQFLQELTNNIKFRDEYKKLKENKRAAINRAKKNMADDVVFYMSLNRLTKITPSYLGDDIATLEKINQLLKVKPEEINVDVFADEIGYLYDKYAQAKTMARETSIENEEIENEEADEILDEDEDIVEEENRHQLIQFANSIITNYIQQMPLNRQTSAFIGMNYNSFTTSQLNSFITNLQYIVSNGSINSGGITFMNNVISNNLIDDFIQNNNKHYLKILNKKTARNFARDMFSSLGNIKMFNVADLIALIENNPNDYSGKFIEHIIRPLDRAMDKHKKAMVNILDKMSANNFGLSQSESHISGMYGLLSQKPSIKVTANLYDYMVANNINTANVFIGDILSSSHSNKDAYEAMRIKSLEHLVDSIAFSFAETVPGFTEEQVQEALEDVYISNNIDYSRSLVNRKINHNFREDVLKKTGFDSVRDLADAILKGTYTVDVKISNYAKSINERFNNIKNGNYTGGETLEYVSKIYSSEDFVEIENYFPIIRSSSVKELQKPLQHKAGSNFSNELFFEIWSDLNINNSFLQKREKVVMPLVTDAYHAFKTRADQQSFYLTHEEQRSYLSELLSHKFFSGDMQDGLNKHSKTIIVEALEQYFNRGNTESKTKLKRNWLLNNLSTATNNMRVSTLSSILKAPAQLSSIVMAMETMKGSPAKRIADLAWGINSVITSLNSTSRDANDKFIMDNAAEIYYRGLTDYDINLFPNGMNFNSLAQTLDMKDYANDKGMLGEIAARFPKQKLPLMALLGMIYFDRIAARVTFMANYKNYLENKGLKYNVNSPNQEALDYALQATRDTQFTDNILYKPTIQLNVSSKGDYISGEGAFNQFMINSILAFKSFGINETKTLRKYRHDMFEAVTETKDVQQFTDGMQAFVYSFVGRLAFQVIKNTSYAALMAGAVAASGGDEEDVISYIAEKLSPVNNTVLSFLDMWQFNIPMQLAISNLMSKAEARIKDIELSDSEMKKYNYVSSIDETDILGFSYSIQDMFKRDLGRIIRDYNDNGLDFSGRQLSAAGLVVVDVLSAAGIHMPLMSTSKSFMKEYNKINQPLKTTVRERRNFKNQ